jgi:glycosyltransferase involved in cell wall biosynthesis
VRLGLIARCDGSGLGTQTLEAYRHLKPAKTLLINVGHLHNDTTHCNKRSYPERYPDALVCNDWAPDTQLLTQFLSGLDVVFSAETFYTDELVPLARRMGVRTVQQPNWEFMRLYIPQPDMLAVPSLWHFDEYPEPRTFLPVPIALDRFPRTSTQNAGSPRGATVVNNAQHFLHIVGRPAIHDRNGTPDVLGALRYVKSDIRLTLKCQDVNYLAQLRMNVHVPPNVEIVTDSTDVRDYWDNYTAGDVMILPRRYGGLCLPANEALGAGMPVIMTNISPNKQWLPAEWLVPATRTSTFMAFNQIDVFQANHVALAAKIDQFASDDGFYAAAKTRADELAKELSWDNLLPEYEKVLTA